MQTHVQGAGLFISLLVQSTILFSVQNQLYYCFFGLVSGLRNLVNLHQYCIWRVRLSLEQSWHQEGRASSSCLHYAEPHCRPRYMARMLHKGLKMKDTENCHVLSFPIDVNC